MKQIGFDLDKSKISSERFLAVLNFYEKNKIYEKFPGVFVNGLFIPIDPNVKHVGLMFSAGADSSILLHILCQIIKEFNYDVKVTPITVVRFWEGREWVVEAKRRVYQYIKNKFPSIVQDQQWGFIPTAFEMTPMNQINLSQKEKERFRHLLETANSDVYFFHCYKDYISKTLNLFSIYDATTTNPIAEEMPESPKFRNHAELIWPNSFNKVIFKSQNYQSVNPFILIEKSWTMAQYENFELHDLKKITRSCVEVDNADEGCGRLDCFHCAERRWSNKNKNIFLKSYHDNHN